MQPNTPSMTQWPPSPSVEDETTALSHEHSIDASIHSLNIEDQPAPSRGSVDQYPIIIDSSDDNRPVKIAAAKPVEQDQLTTDTGSSDDSTGPPTPPPLYRKEQKKPNPASTTQHKGQNTPTASSPLPSISHGEVSGRGRPQMTRIQTDLGSDVRAKVTGSGRPPSPYSHTRAPTFHHLSAGHVPTMETFLSPAHAAASPTSFAYSPRQAPVAASDTAERPENLAHATKGEPVQHSRPQSRYGDLQPGKQNGQSPRANPRAQVDSWQSHEFTPSSNRRSYHEDWKRPDYDTKPLSPPHSRRASRDSEFGSSGEDRSVRHASAYAGKLAKDARISPYNSSAEESSRRHGHRIERSSGDERHPTRRKSSYRSERPVLVDKRQEFRPENISSATMVGTEPRVYSNEPRNRYPLNLATSITSEFSHAVTEDVFARALEKNEHKWSRHGPSPRSSGSVVASPLSSPPRTPRSERQSKDYFDLTPTAQRPAHRSRPPSMDEGQIKDLKMHGTLLSAATAGAALAARGSGGSSRSSDPPTAINSTATTSKASSAPRSRRSSPVHEKSHQPTQSAPVNMSNQPSLNTRVNLTPSYEMRTDSRGNFNNTEGAYPYPHPTRALSYSGPDHTRIWTASYPTSAVSPMYSSPSAAAGGGLHVPLPRSARSSVQMFEPLSTAKDIFGFPICPRSQPSVGCNDWSTIKELAEVEICPTCMTYVSNTAYRGLFVRSLARPYSEPSVCAMSKPWVRHAFMQSLKQKRPDLNYIRIVTSAHRDKAPCPGSRKDARTWYRFRDPEKGEFVPDLFACSACVRLVDNVFPQVSSLLDKPKTALVEEQSCNLHVDTKHFDAIVEQMGHAEARCRGGWRTADVLPLIKVLRRVARYRPCPRDEVQANRTWHYMHDLPEFTICEECYDEVVWPVGDQRIAREISQTSKLTPMSRASTSHNGASCQLYSSRMRKIFQDAVSQRNFVLLRDAVLNRLHQQHRLNEMNRLCEQDMKFSNIDRRHEIERNKQIWRTIE